MRISTILLVSALAAGVAVSVVCNTIQYQKNCSLANDIEQLKQSVSDASGRAEEAVKTAETASKTAENAADKKTEKSAPESAGQNVQNGTQASAQQELVPFEPVYVKFYTWNGGFFELDFPASIKACNYRDYITVTPKVDFSVQKRYSSELRIYGNFKPEQVYHVKLKPGLEAAQPEFSNGKKRYVASKKEKNYSFIPDDLDPETEFLTNGFIYPLHAEIRELPLRITNPGKNVEVSVRKAHLKDAYALQNRSFESVSQPVISKNLPVNVKKNERTAVGLELDKLGLERKPGLYIIEIKPADGGYYDHDTATMLVTDMALACVTDHDSIKIAVSSIATAKPVVGASVKVYSAKRRLLCTVVTDANGFASVSKDIVRKSGDESDRIELLVAEKDDDVSFISMDSADWIGRKELSPVTVDKENAFVYMERDICRPGEKITAFFMFRDASGNAYPDVPCSWIISYPNGRTLKKETVTADSAGCGRITLELPANAPTGTYSVELCPSGDSESRSLYGDSSFTVAEYVPDTLKVTASSSVSEHSDGLNLSVEGGAKYYFGAPLQGGLMNFVVRASWGKFKPDAFKDYSFNGDASQERLNGLSGSYSMDGTTDDNGNYRAQIKLNKVVPAASPIVFDVTASAQSGAGGRSVSGRAKSFTYHVAPYYVGVKEQSADEQSKTFSVIAVTPDGKRIMPNASSLEFRLVQLTWDYTQRESSNGRWYWEWKLVEQVLEKGGIKFQQDLLLLNLHKGGNYELRIVDTKQDDLVLARYPFWFYGGEAGERSSNPNILSFALDRESGKPGDTVAVTFESSVTGTGMMASGSAHIDRQERFNVKPGKNTVNVTIPADIASGSYYAYIVLAGRTGEKDVNGSRCAGIVEIPVDLDSRKLTVELNAPELARPEETLALNVKLKNASGAPESGTVQVWAVDAGVLALTGFKTPDPFSYFFGSYGCPWQAADVYNQLYDQISLERKLIGGDGVAAALASNLSERSEQQEAAAAFLLDTLNVPASGSVSASVKLPKHTGALRIMAVAVNDKKLGSGERDLTMRDELSLKVTAPRVLAPEDTFSIAVDAFNHDLAAKDAVITVDSVSGAELLNGKDYRSNLVLEKGKSAALKDITFKVASDAETVRCRVNMTLGGRTVREDVAVTVRAPLPSHNELKIEALASGAEKTYTVGKFGKIEVGSPVLFVSGALEFLKNYPYGCLEQTVSGAFPYLAVKPLTDAGVLDPLYALSAGTVIESAFSRLRQLQCGSGYYSMWGEDSRWFEGTLYAWHFMAEADAGGYDVLNESKKDKIISNLRQICNNRQNTLATRAYACYILSLLDMTNAGRYAELIVSEDDITDYQRFLCAAAMIRSGRASEGMKILEPLMDKKFWIESDGDRFSHFDSEVRRMGLALWILADIKPDAAVCDQLALEIQSRIQKHGHWGTTQNNAWCALGLSRLAARDASGGRKLNAHVNGSRLDGMKRFSKAGETVTVKNTGDAHVYIYVTERVTPKTFEPENNEFIIKKTFLNANGEPVASAMAGELLTVQIEVTTKGVLYEDVVLCDLLPGGLEIEDETLLTRASFMPLKNGDDLFRYRPLRERRFDRFLAFGDISSRKSGSHYTISYRVRAVARGTFAMPPVQIESMYAPEQRATGRSSETFTVK